MAARPGLGGEWGISRRAELGAPLLEPCRVQMPGKVGSAVRHHRDRVLHPVGTQARRVQEPEERPQPAAAVPVRRRRPQLRNRVPLRGFPDGS
jgi:hypothetical protein